MAPQHSTNRTQTSLPAKTVITSRLRSSLCVGAPLSPPSLPGLTWLDPPIHRTCNKTYLEEDGPPELGYTRVRAHWASKSAKSTCAVKPAGDASELSIDRARTSPPRAS